MVLRVSKVCIVVSAVAMGVMLGLIVFIPFINPPSGPSYLGEESLRAVIEVGKD